MAIILSSSLSQMLRLDRVSRGGYTHPDNTDGTGGQRGSFINAIGGRRARHNQGGRSNVDAENQLIDQLDEEWDD